MGSRRSEVTRLRPPVAARLTNVVAGMLPVFPALYLGAGETGLPEWSGIVPLAAAAVFGVRGYRLSADCAGGTVIVHGWFRDRTITCADVTYLNRRHRPSIIWRDADGRERETGLPAFRSSPRFPSHDLHHAGNLQRLARHIKTHNGKPGK